MTVQHVEGAGVYGHNASDDAAADAVLLARAVPGRPVTVLWSRPDELSWGPLGPAMLARLSAGLDWAGADPVLAAGRVEQRVRRPAGHRR